MSWSSLLFSWFYGTEQISSNTITALSHTGNTGNRGVLSRQWILWPAAMGYTQSLSCSSRDIQSCHWTGLPLSWDDWYPLISTHTHHNGSLGRLITKCVSHEPQENSLMAGLQTPLKSLSLTAKRRNFKYSFTHMCFRHVSDGYCV